jgi:hypothetical protein
MGIFDYSNLKDAGVAAKENVASGGWKPLEEGEFLSKFRGGERTLTQGRGGKPKRPMLVTEWKVVAPENERMHREDLKIRFMVEFDFQMDRFLALLVEAGVDLGTVGDRGLKIGDKVWDEVFEELDDSKLSAKWKIYYNDSDKEEDGSVKKGSYPEFRLVEVVNGIDSACQFADANHEPPASDAAEEPEAVPAEKPAKAKKTKAKAKSAKEAEPESPAEPEPTPEPEPAPEEDADSSDSELDDPWD